MTTVAVKETVAADAEAVWNILSDFAGIKIGGPITDFQIEGEGVGAIRTITMGGGKVIERLETFDSVGLTFSYVITNQDSSLPVTNYASIVKITSEGPGACSVEWTGTFEPRGVPEEQAQAIINGIYTGGIQRARKTLGG
jgi:hypothetical protein